MLHYTIEDGLPSNTIYDIYRDSKGYLWIGTDKGVAKYNGIKFETFTTNDGLPDNEVFFFKEDYYGRLWLATYSGALCYYQGEVFHTAANTPFLKLPFKTSFVGGIFVENDSSVSIAFGEQFNFVNICKGRCASYHVKYEYLSNSIQYIKKIKNVGFELTFNDRKVLVDTNNNIIKENKYTGPKLEYIFNQDSSYFYNDSVIFSGNYSVVGRFRAHFFDKNILHRMYINENSKIYATDNGLIINDSINILYGDKASAITQDNVGNYWVGTLNYGLYSKSRFNAVLYKNTYNGKAKYCVDVHNKAFFTTEDNNLYVLRHGRPLCLFDNKKYSSDNIKYTGESAYFLTDSLKYYAVHNNTLLIIEDVLAKTKKIKRSADESFLNTKSLFPSGDYLYLQKRRNITAEDLKKLKQNGPVGEIRLIPRDFSGTFRIYSVAKAPDNTIWYSTINEVYKIEDRKDILQPQFGNIAFKYFIFHGKFLLGYTQDNQLFLVSNIDGKPIIDSVPFQNCVWDKFYALDSAHLLISSNNLYQLLTLYPAGSIKKFSVTAIENPYLPLLAETICADSSDCYFFKNGSITEISIKSLLNKADPPQLFFRTLRTSKRSYNTDSALLIPYDESRNIVLSFSTISFDGKNVKYEYSFSKGEQESWQPIAGEQINIADPGFGDYVIKVRAKTISSSYCSPIVFTLHIVKPYWATWWFITICSGFLLTILAITIRYRIRSEVIKKEKEHKDEVKFMKLEYKALNALMNPHFIFNTLNNVQGLINKDEKRAANEYLRIFANLIRQNMHNISLELIPVQNEMDIVANYLKLEKLRFKDFLNFSINVAPEIDLSEIFIPPLLVQPLVENSIKHGILPRKSKDSFISIDINEHADYLVIAVKDNGIGMGEARKRSNKLHESYGLENIRKRIEQLAIIQGKEIKFQISEINDDAGNLQWTVVSISINIS
jgi:two-component sensor histidine kinase